MMMKSDANPAPPAATACGNCGLEERRFLHYFRHRGIFRRLCTTCVLRLNPQSFCPTCFSVHHPSPPPSSPNDTITCVKCYSSSHSHCVGPNIHGPYTCPLCLSPNGPIFSLQKAGDLGADGGRSVKGEGYRAIDKRASRILLAAARIASMTMNKAAMAAKAEAERRAKEAAYTRKRAREALEHVAYLVTKDKLRKKEGMMSPPGVPGSAGGNFGSVPGKLDGKGVNGSGVAAGVPSVVSVEGKNQAANVNRMDSSGDVLAALNAVDLREKERLQHGFKGTNSSTSRTGLIPPPNKRDGLMSPPSVSRSTAGNVGSHMGKVDKNMNGTNGSSARTGPMPPLINNAARDELKKEGLISPSVSGSPAGNVGSVLGKMDNSMNGSGVAAMDRKDQEANVHRIDGSTQVLAALNAVDLREKKRLQQGFKGPNESNVGSGPLPTVDNAVAMDIDGTGVMRAAPGAEAGGSAGDNHVNSNVERSDLPRLSDSNHVEGNSDQGNASLQPVGDQVQHVKINHSEG